MALLIIPDREQEVRTATYGPEIDQSQHAKSVSHIIITVMFENILRTFVVEILKIFKNVQFKRKN